MLLLYLVYLSLLSLLLEGFDSTKLNVDTCNDQVCYVPASCASNSPDDKSITRIKKGARIGNCDFWFTLNPFSDTTALIRSSSNKDLKVELNNNTNPFKRYTLFSCTKKNESVILEVKSYTTERVKTSIVDRRLFCEFKLKKQYTDIVPKMDSDSDATAKMIITIGDTPYEYDNQYAMKGHVGGTKRCNPDQIIFDANTYKTKNDGYHYKEVNAEFNNVICPENYKLLVDTKPATSLICEDVKVRVSESDPTLKVVIKYVATPSSSAVNGLAPSQTFHAACKSNEKLCRLCDTTPSSTCISNSCPQLKSGVGSSCHSFACTNKILKTGSVISLKGDATCTPSLTTVDTFEWTVAGVPITSTTKVECVSEVDCQEINPVEKACVPQSGCDKIDYYKPPLKCPDGFTMTVHNDERKKPEPIESISCNRSTGEWLRSDDKSFPRGSVFNCLKGGLSGGGGEGSTTSVSPLAQAGNDPDWALIGGIGGGVIILLLVIVAVIALWCVYTRRKKRTPPAAAATSPAPSPAPSSQPPSSAPPSTPLQQPSSGSASYGKPSPAVSPIPTPPPVVVPPTPPVQKIVVVVKHEEEKKKVKSQMETINIKGMQDEKSREAPSQTGEKLSDRTIEKSKIEKETENSKVEKELSKTIGTTKEIKSEAQSDVQKKKSKKEKVNLTKTEDDSKSFIEAYNKELDKKMTKKKE